MVDKQRQPSASEEIEISPEMLARAERALRAWYYSELWTDKGARLIVEAVLCPSKTEKTLQDMEQEARETPQIGQHDIIG